MYLDTNEASELTFKGFVGLYTLQTGACSGSPLSPLRRPHRVPADASPSPLSCPQRTTRPRRSRTSSSGATTLRRSTPLSTRSRRRTARPRRDGSTATRRYPGWLDTSAMHSYSRSACSLARRSERKAHLLRAATSPDSAATRASALSFLPLHLPAPTWLPDSDQQECAGYCKRRKSSSRTTAPTTSLSRSRCVPTASLVLDPSACGS